MACCPLPMTPLVSHHHFSREPTTPNIRTPTLHTAVKPGRWNCMSVLVSMLPGGRRVTRMTFGDQIPPTSCPAQNSAHPGLQSHDPCTPVSGRLEKRASSDCLHHCPWVPTVTRIAWGVSPGLYFLARLSLRDGSSPLRVSMASILEPSGLILSPLARPSGNSEQERE
ncbi:uncharacterized protein LY79DRAFT_358129 [Colletotrichum navitas]|uniref:Uncharacterized protein n=1 Tax=Colletotrichum navitas TaxID=681940 RepID=A0AAD8PR56_9PEZI|nr:uncharacterized protein LY79DRAFT_358129 [Colletotrichum navitas]KAK1579181.1 hypothetical protein LY79DRAFT_358129 [Colletotrichum navitas]